MVGPTVSFNLAASFNLADLFESVAASVADRIAVVAGDRRLTYAALDERADRLADVLARSGIGRGDFVGVQLPNGSEYLEVMLAAFKLRAVPVNVNYRYVGDELRHLYADAGLVALVHHRDFAAAVGSALDAMAERRAVLAVGDDGDYEDALAAATVDRPYPARSGDDLYCVYTGGTTGLPKGVLWRHEDIFFAAMGGGDPFQFGDHIERPDQLPGRIPDPGLVALAAPPFMHAAAHWLAFAMFFGGGTVVTLPSGRFDARSTLRLVDRERVNILVVVGDAMARPLVDALESDPEDYDLSSLMALGSGGALLSPSTKARLRRLRPTLIVRDAFGASETGQIGGQPPAGDPDGAPRLHVDERTVVLDDQLRPVVAGSGAVGRLARGGRVPLRYLGDPEKS
ncbi:MAG: AMP-binding protein, partial [Actinobacteria bacterium]|nr:AMP-binding protein [Actinomycetota bacterium]